MQKTKIVRNSPALLQYIDGSIEEVTIVDTFKNCIKIQFKQNWLMRFLGGKPKTEWFDPTWEHEMRKLTFKTEE